MCFLHQDEAHSNVTIDAFHPYNPLNQGVNGQADNSQVGRELQGKLCCSKIGDARDR
ncbi:hypothetical protein SCLCIDRAFT_1218831 [Scleroderma citrinum Foug A]|uniref:Uncharacterized protein n=1 Tax=Scleroderma citrinum Foug A TaxID=1036808 RepID=A0A0C3DQC6_9AGAM|nr:hypothetical protein SCLCIDRAFT_1218831 [Scleroderma citrinum Foug A]